MHLLAQHFEEAKASAHRIIEVALRPMTIRTHRLQTGDSIGIALFPDDADNIKDLNHKADKMHYAAKLSGKSQFCFYRPVLNDNRR